MCLCYIVAGVQVSQYDEQFVQLFTQTVQQLKAMLPISTNIKEAYKQGSNDEQNFIQNLSLFLCTFLKEHGQLIEKKADLGDLLMEVSMIHNYCRTGKCGDMKIWQMGNSSA